MISLRQALQIIAPGASRMPAAAPAARVTPQAECSGQHVLSAGSLAC